MVESTKVVGRTVAGSEGASISFVLILGYFSTGLHELILRAVGNYLKEVPIIRQARLYVIRYPSWSNGIFKVGFSFTILDVPEYADHTTIPIKRVKIMHSIHPLHFYLGYSSVERLIEKYW